MIDQSRKRGTLESDLLFSTFANENLVKMTRAQLQEYDLFLDENDWDLYYWATQSPANTPTTLETAEGTVNNTPAQTTTEYQAPAAPGQTQETDAWRQGGKSDNLHSTGRWSLTPPVVAPRSGEWSQTVGKHIIQPTGLIFELT